MKIVKALFLIVLLTCLIGVGVVLYIQKEQPPLEHTLSPFFQQLGKPFKTVDRAISRVLPINEIDEKMIGDEFKSRFELMTASQTEEQAKTAAYLNRLMRNITHESKKPFKYQVFVVPGEANAFALPGGVIGVTTGLLDLLENEAELVSILSHEAGHIERGHLFDAVRGEMLRRKIHEATVIVFADNVISFLPRISFSKAQEDESDEFAFRMLIIKGYDLSAMGDSFEKLLSISHHSHSAPSPLQDFFATHPQLQLRSRKFHAMADQWRAKNPGTKMYRGQRNYTEKLTRQEQEYPEEFR